jgi:hypothetical protein
VKIDREIKVINTLKKREYHKIYYLKNKEKLSKLSKEYRLKNKEFVNKRDKTYRLNYKDKRNKYQKEYYLKNPHLRFALNAKRRGLKLNATPKFANLNKIKEIYKNCPKGFHVDHIIPLNNKLVCGLHVEWNLQYLPAKENLSKSNKLM